MRNHGACALCDISAGEGYIEAELFNLPEYEVKVCDSCLRWAKHNTAQRIERFLFGAPKGERRETKGKGGKANGC